MTIFVRPSKVSLHYTMTFKNKILKILNAMQCNSTQCNATQFNAMQLNSVQCNATKVNPMQLNAMQCNGIMSKYVGTKQFKINKNVLGQNMDLHSSHILNLTKYVTICIHNEVQIENYTWS